MTSQFSNIRKWASITMHGVVSGFLLLLLLMKVLSGIRGWIPIMPYVELQYGDTKMYLIPLIYGLMMGYQRWRFFVNPRSKIWLWPSFLLIPIIIFIFYGYLTGQNIQPPPLSFALLIIWLGPWAIFIAAQTIINKILQKLALLDEN